MFTGTPAACSPSCPVDLENQILACSPPPLPSSLSLPKSGFLGLLRFKGGVACPPSSCVRRPGEEESLFTGTPAACSPSRPDDQENQILALWSVNMVYMHVQEFIVCIINTSKYRHQVAHELVIACMHHISKGLYDGRLWEFNIQASSGTSGFFRLFSQTPSFLLIFKVQCCSLDGFLMLSLFSSPFCCRAPPSHMHAHVLTQDSDPFGTHGLMLKWVVYLALRLDMNSPFKISNAPFSCQPSPRAFRRHLLHLITFPLLWDYHVFKHRSCFRCIDAPCWFFTLRFALASSAHADFERLTLQRIDHRNTSNLVHLLYSLLQLNTTFWQSDRILLFPLLSDFLGVFAWFPVVPCFGGSVRFPGSGVQQSWPS